MFTAKIENANGIITLTQNESQWQVVSIVGLNPPKAIVNTTSIAGLDGAVFNSSKIGTRNIVITLQLNSNIEQNRLMFYRMFRSKVPCTFYFQNESVNAQIVGYVDTCECNLFRNAQQMQVSMICPTPFFQSVREYVVDITNRYGMFEFPFYTDSPIPMSGYQENRITNIFNSSSETGMIIEVEANGLIESVKVMKVDTDEFIQVNQVLTEGEKLLISTYKGKKSITLVRDNEELNVFGSLEEGSTFLQLEVGNNLFSYLLNDGEGDASVKIRYRELYRGV